jgi:dUTP pyrophosphatase|tara:strand:- start:127 stop:552 length:426 start_codon:yes stop_codon:yes gene_type:complete
MELIKAKKLDPEAIIPTKSHQSDAGWDLYALESGHVTPKGKALIKTGVSLEIPDGFVGLIWPRSGLAVKSGIDVFAGVVDSGYRGDVGVCLYNSEDSAFEFKKGDRIAQILFQEVPNFKIQETTELDRTSRGEEGFGSSGS